MEDFVLFFGPSFGLIMVIYWFFRYLQNRSDNTNPEPALSKDCIVNKEPMNSNIYNGMNKKTMLETALKNCGCHINLCDEKDGEIRVTYQGEHFLVVYSEDSPFITIYDSVWYSAKLFDIDNFSIVKQAVNLCNQNYQSTVFYSIDKENNHVNVHTRQCVVFGSFIPELEAYLRSRFEDSFQQHHNFYRNMEISRKEQFA